MVSAADCPGSMEPTSHAHRCVSIIVIRYECQHAHVAMRSAAKPFLPSRIPKAKVVSSVPVQCARKWKIMCHINLAIVKWQRIYPTQIAMWPHAMGRRRRRRRRRWSNSPNLTINKTLTKQKRLQSGVPCRSSAYCVRRASVFAESANRRTNTHTSAQWTANERVNKARAQRHSIYTANGYGECNDSPTAIFAAQNQTNTKSGIRVPPHHSLSWAVLPRAFGAGDQRRNTQPIKLYVHTAHCITLALRFLLFYQPKILLLVIWSLLKRFYHRKHRAAYSQHTSSTTSQMAKHTHNRAHLCMSEERNGKQHAANARGVCVFVCKCTASHAAAHAHHSPYRKCKQKWNARATICGANNNNNNNGSQTPDVWTHSNSTQSRIQANASLLQLR